jgi:hypothetical protein
MIVNLDQIAVIDVDPVPNRPDVAVVRVLASGAAAEAFISPQLIPRLLDLVEAAKRFPANDALDK